MKEKKTGEGRRKKEGNKEEMNSNKIKQAEVQV